jgi:hypothetical protein
MKLPNRKGDGLSQTNLRPHFALSATYGAESVAAGLNLPRAGELSEGLSAGGEPERLGGSFKFFRNRFEPLAG